ncbi:DUF4097 family beta strand repeat protein [Lactobacillus sp. DCY120]|uniref:DUF4097 family beta strand repeat protein n=1 Tax=Bombilactobacillus apium TaxID=2675299 RepID=A0A850R9M2_9LACO|nr:DUF4097 family beta strand repeat-containing protein [Bombilactobacillus apium]NVY96086.1 DUF4097 family beta strand repeat protein [Bombilactobacillus apium]
METVERKQSKNWFWGVFLILGIWWLYQESQGIRGSQVISVRPQEVQTLEIETPVRTKIKRGDRFQVKYRLAKSAKPKISIQGQRVKIICGAQKSHASFSIGDWGTGPWLEVTLPNNLNPQEVLVQSQGDFSAPGLKTQKLKIKNTSGDLNLSELQVQKMELQNRSGDVTLSKIWPQSQQIKIQNQSGDLKINRFETKKLAIDNQSGDLNLKQLQVKTAKIKSRSGDLHFAQITGNDLQLRSHSGDVRIDRSKFDQGQVQTDFGDILIKHSNLQPVKVQTNSGTIRS